MFNIYSRFYLLQNISLFSKMVENDRRNIYLIIVIVLRFTLILSRRIKLVNQISLKHIFQQITKYGTQLIFCIEIVNKFNQ